MYNVCKWKPLYCGKCLEDCDDNDNDDDDGGVDDDDDESCSIARAICKPKSILIHESTLSQPRVKPIFFYFELSSQKFRL